MYLLSMKPSSSCHKAATKLCAPYLWQCRCGVQEAVLVLCLELCARHVVCIVWGGGQHLQAAAVCHPRADELSQPWRSGAGRGRPRLLNASL